MKQSVEKLEEQIREIILYRYSDGVNVAERTIKAITELIDQAQQEAIEKLKIGQLRQWLNEDRITDPKRMVSNEEIRFMLGIDKQLGSLTKVDK